MTRAKTTGSRGRNARQQGSRQAKGKVKCARISRDDMRLGVGGGPYVPMCVGCGQRVLLAKSRWSEATESRRAASEGSRLTAFLRTPLQRACQMRAEMYKHTKTSSGTPSQHAIVHSSFLPLCRCFHLPHPVTRAPVRCCVACVTVCMRVCTLALLGAFGTNIGLEPHRARDVPSDTLAILLKLFLACEPLFPVRHFAWQHCHILSVNA
jgi:hypothetical protein